MGRGGGGGAGGGEQGGRPKDAAHRPKARTHSESSEEFEEDQLRELERRLVEAWEYLQSKDDGKQASDEDRKIRLKGILPMSAKENETIRSRRGTPLKLNTLWRNIRNNESKEKADDLRERLAQKKPPIKLDDIVEAQPPQEPNRVMTPEQQKERVTIIANAMLHVRRRAPGTRLCRHLSDRDNSSWVQIRNKPGYVLRLMLEKLLWTEAYDFIKLDEFIEEQEELVRIEKQRLKANRLKRGAASADQRPRKAAPEKKRRAAPRRYTDEENLIRFNALTKIFDDMGIKQIPDIEGGRGRRS